MKKIIYVTILVFTMIFLSACGDSTKPKNITYREGAFVGHGFVKAMDYKMLIMEYYQNYGKFPCSNEDLKIKPSNYRSMPALRSIDVTACGEITVTYNEKSGVDNGHLLIQMLDLKGHDLDWDCKTTDYPGIEKFIPQCRYLFDD